MFAIFFSTTRITGIMKRAVFLSPIFWLSLIILSLPAQAAAENNCLVCHTNDAVMKTLVKPPEIKSEGEG